VGIRLGNKEVRKRVLLALRSKKLGAKALAERTRISRVTLTKHLPELLNDGCVMRDRNTLAYCLGEKGLSEIDQMKEDEWFEKHKREEYLSGAVEGKLEVLDGLWVGRATSNSDLPLPIPAIASVYLSEEFVPSFNYARFIDRIHGVGSKTIPRRLLEGTVGDIVKQFWILNEQEWMIRLVEWHVRYQRKETKVRPPPFNLESVLNFNLGVTFRYEGKAAVEKWRNDPASAEKARCRFLGVLLLRMAFSYVMTTDFSYEKLVKLMTGTILSNEEGKKILQLLIRIHGKREVEGTGGSTRRSFPSERESHRATKELATIALTYLQKGQALAIGENGRDNKDDTYDNVSIKRIVDAALEAHTQVAI